MKPIIKTIKPINFLYFRAETRMDQLVNFIPVAQELFREAVTRNLKITGPIHWHYFGASGDASKVFTLEVCLPVAEVIEGYDGSFHFKRTGSFRCVTLTHDGGWDQIPASYGTIVEFMQDQKLEYNGITREMYVNSDFNDASANITEIQMGVI